MDKLRKQMEFVMEIDKLKNIFRHSLVTHSLRNENDAEHSWHLAIMCVILGEYAPENTDILTCIKMVLAHDLVEIYAGDTYCYDYEAMKDKAKREEEAAEKLYSILSDEQKNDFISLWHEFEECKTKESVFANILDRLEPVMLNYYTGGKAWMEHNITKEEVLSTRLHLVYEYGDIKLQNFVTELVENAYNKGYLK